MTTTSEVTPSGTVITATQSAPEGPARPFLTLGLGVGAGFSQVMSELGTSFAATLDIGYLLPVLEERIALSTWASYRRPKHTETIDDPRLPEPSTTTLTEQELIVGLGGVGRLFPAGTQLNFLGRLGFQVHLQQSGEKAKAGASFGANDEQRTSAGMVVGGGAEWMLGPGALAGELQLDFANLDHQMTGNTTAGGLSLLVGYRLVL